MLDRRAGRNIVPFFIAPLAGTHQYMQTFIPG
jgi:hypothetical protein